MSYKIYRCPRDIDCSFYNEQEGISERVIKDIQMPALRDIDCPSYNEHENILERVIKDIQMSAQY